MEFIKKNKILLIICASAIIVTLIIVLLINHFKYTETYEYSYKSDYLKDYKINEAVPIIVDKEQMAKKYLVDYVNLLINDRQKAYELLDSDYSAEKFGSIDAFNDYIDQIMDVDLIKASVSEYATEAKGDYTLYDIIDAGGNKFFFKETSIMNYTVMFDNYTV